MSVEALVEREPSAGRNVASSATLNRAARTPEAGAQLRDERDAGAAAETRGAAAADARAALGSVLLGALGASMVAGRFETVALAIAVSVTCAALAGASWPRRGWWIALAWGVGLAFVLNAYLVRGVPLGWPRLFGLWASAEGARAGVLLGLRLLGAALAVHALAAAWPGERAADELAARLRPLERLGLPVREARAVTALALRFVPLVRDEYRRIARLQDLRAGRPPRGLGERLLRHRAVAVPAVVAAIETAEKVALALEARHYRLRTTPRAAGGWKAAVVGGMLLLMALVWRA